MQIGTTEHYEMISGFEKHMKTSPIRARFEKEEKEHWNKGRIYQCGNTNDLFRVYSAGYALARCNYLQIP